MTDRDFARLARRIVPDEQLANLRSQREIVDADDRIKASALPPDVVTSFLGFWVAGSITLGSSIAQQWALPSKSRIRLVRVLFKGAPGAAQQISLMAAGSPIVIVALASGQVDRSQAVAVDVDAGVLLEIKALASTGSNLSVSVWYEPGVS